MCRPYKSPTRHRPETQNPTSEAICCRQTPANPPNSDLTLTVGLPDGYDAESTAAAVTSALARQPRHLIKTLTWDQGREMARWPDVEAALGIDVCFCDPHSPWQRPTNEHTNGLLRRWLPKSTDLNIGTVRLALIEDSLNTMPRKLHDWDSAHSVYAALCRNHR